MVTTPAFAASATTQAVQSTSAASSLSVARASNVGRAGAKMRGANSLAGGNGLGIVMLGIVAAGAVWAAIEMTKDDNDSPASP
jgi:hypothetical protein